MASSSHTQLALNIIGENFGEIVKIVARALLRVDKSTIPDIIRRVKKEVEHSGQKRSAWSRLDIDSAKIKRAISILCQHNCLDVVMPTKEELSRSRQNIRLFYRLKPEACIEFLRRPRFIHLANVMHGNIASSMVEMLLVHGRLKRRDLVDHVVQTMSTSPEDISGKDEELLTRRVERAFDILVQERYIVKVPPLDLSRPSEPPVRNNEKLMKALNLPIGPEKNDANSEKKEVDKVRKRRHIENADDEETEVLPMEMQMMLDNARLFSGDQAPVASSKSEATMRNFEYDENEFDEDGPPKKRTRGGGRGGSRGARRGRGRGGKHGAKESNIPNSEENPNQKQDSSAASQMIVNDVPPATSITAPRPISEVQLSTVWTVGFDQFHRVIRHSMCMKLVRDYMPNKLAQDIMLELMKLAAPMERTASDSHSVSVLFSELLRVLTTPTPTHPRLYKIGAGSTVGLANSQTIRVFLQHFASRKLSWVTEVVDRGEGARFIVNYGNIISYIQQRALHTFITDKYDIRTARICRVLMEKRYMEESILSDMILLPARETREKLYKLQQDRIVFLQEVPRVASHEPKSTTYLWSIKPALVLATVTKNIEKSVLNVRLRRQHLYATNRHSLEHADKFKTMETEHRAKLIESLDRLSMAELKLDETLMLFQTF